MNMKEDSFWQCIHYDDMMAIKKWNKPPKDKDPEAYQLNLELWKAIKTK